MIKIGIVTFTYGDNYGQRLQNYAVQSIFSQYGYDTYTLPQKESLKNKIRNEIQAVKKKEYVEYKLRKLNFKKFDKKHIKYFRKKISDRQVLSYLNSEFDYFVAGSDQIWSPVSDDVNDTMFLTFAERSKRIALAPSIGIDSIPDTKIESYTNFFRGFDYISVREKSAADIIYELTKQEADVLIDPTLMIDVEEWQSMEVKPNIELPERYVLYYHLGSDAYRSGLSRFADELDSQPLDIRSDKRLLCTGPSEFIWLIHHAKGIITDSYHGTIFSMIFHIPFLVCKRRGSNIDMECRFNTLFDMFPNMRHYIDDYQKDSVYDFEQFETKKKLEQEKVKDFLKKALSRCQP